MDAVNATYGRGAIRNFTDAAIPQEEIAALIDAAIQAPSGMNRQPWSFRNSAQGGDDAEPTS
jgi:nitroreductase